MSLKDIASHRHIASTLNFYELGSLIKKLAQEKQDLASFLAAKDLEKYDIALGVYIQELEYFYTLTHPQLLKNTH